MLNYKKPRFWILLFSTVIVVVFGIVLTVNPKSQASFNGPPKDREDTVQGSDIQLLASSNQPSLSLSQPSTSFGGATYRVKEILY